MVPPYIKREGMLSLPIAMRQPGMFLSQPPMATRPSNLSASETNSMESAITSQLGREYFMPGVPMDMPSLTVIVLNMIGAPPDSFTPSLERRASLSMCMLQGVTSAQVEAIPTMGLVKSASLKPTARSILRFGARSGPSVKIELFVFKDFLDIK